MTQGEFEFEDIDWTRNGKQKPIGEHLRDKKLAQVLGNAGSIWINKVYRLVAQELRGQVIPGEYIRHACEDEGIVPHHNNAWGGIVDGMVRCGLLTPVEETQKMTDPRSHARKTDLYQVTPGFGATMTQEEIIQQIVRYEVQRINERDAIKQKHRDELKEFDSVTRKRMSELKTQAKQAK